MFSSVGATRWKLQLCYEFWLQLRLHAAVVKVVSWKTSHQPAEGRSIVSSEDGTQRTIFCVINMPQHGQGVMTGQQKCLQQQPGLTGTTRRSSAWKGTEK